jgi:hypothetical protein
MKAFSHLWQFLAEFFLLEWEMFQTEIVEKINTHYMFSNFFFSENPAVYETIAYRKMWWSQIIRCDNMTHARCMLDNSGYTPAPVDSHTTM